MKKISYIIFFIILLVTCLLSFKASKLKFDYNLDHFFPESDKELDFFKQFKNDFSSDDDFLVLALENNNQSVFDIKFLKQVASLTQDLKSNQLIESVFSITTLSNPKLTPFGVQQEKYLHLNDLEKFKLDSFNIYSSQNIVGNFIANDAKSVCLYLNLKPNIIKPNTDTLLNQIKRALHQHKINRFHIAGKIQAQKVYIEQMQYEMLLFTSISLVLIIVLLYLTFKSWWGILLPIIVILLSIIWTLGIYDIFNMHIDILTVVLPSILFVVGMSDVVHFCTKYLEEIRGGLTKEKAILKTLKEVGFATFLTAFTTALGFATLASSNILPIRNFGIFTAIGVIIAYCLSFTLLPAIFIHIQIPIKKLNEESFWDKKLHQLLLFILRKKKLIVFVFLIITSFSIFYISKIKINSKILDDLSEKSELLQDFTFFEKKYGGVRTFEMELSVKDSTSIFELQALNELENVEQYLKETYKVNNLTSPLTLIKSLNKALNNGENQFYTLPKNQNELDLILKYLLKIKKRKEFKKYIHLEKNKARISGKVEDLGSLLMMKKNDDFYTFLAKIPNKKLNYKITGTAHLINLNNDYIAKDMIQGISLDLVVIFLIVFFMFLSFKMGFIVVIINFIPLIMVGALMGFLNIDLKVSTSIVFSIAFGIAVDDTIHFISKFKQELRCKSIFYALKRTYISTGKAIIVTSLLLVGGFATLMFSDFKGTFYLGFLVSITLFIAILTDLFLLPILVIYFYKKKS